MNQPPPAAPAASARQQAAPLSALNRARLMPHQAAQAARELPARLRALPGQARKSWAWLLVAFMYLGAWWIPFQWSKEEWFRAHHVEFFQPWMPLATLFLIYTRREKLHEVWGRSLRKRQTRNIGFWERGNAIPLIAGCALLLLMHLIQMKGVSVIALLLIAVGIAYQLFGARVLRAMAAPWALLLFMIPLPDSLLVKIGDIGAALTVKMLVMVLGLLHRPAVAEGTGIRYLGSDFTVSLTTPGMGEVVKDVPIGIDIAVGVGLAVLIYGLYKRQGSLQIVAAMLNGVTLSLFLNFVRMLIVCLISERAPGVAERFRDYNVWLMVPLVSLLTLLLARAQARWHERWFTVKPGGVKGSRFDYVLQRTGHFVSLPFLPLFMALGIVSRAGGGVGNIARRNEQRTERALKTVSPLTRVLLLPITLLQRSEKAIEQLMRRMTKRGRGGQGRSGRRQH